MLRGLPSCLIRRLLLGWGRSLLDAVDEAGCSGQRERRRRWRGGDDCEDEDEEARLFLSHTVHRGRRGNVCPPKGLSLNTRNAPIFHLH